jgi:tRNA A-37 threonylcarbamoyl transferase component Bud32/tetratricopeptide (TPR) repeat protein
VNHDPEPGDGPPSDDELDRAIGEWLLRKEDDPALLPGDFARQLPPSLRSVFLHEIESLADLDVAATQSAPRDLPRRFGDFRILGELGRGAMGAVFAAEQVSRGRRVALKVMHQHVAGEAQARSRFRREAHTAASLEHPGIVPVLEFGETDGNAWLAMNYVDGRSLQRLIAAARDPRDIDHARARQVLDDPRRVAAAIAGVAEALAFAHDHGVVHRDVKPANLMVDGAGRFLVLDFGLATALDRDAPTLTRTGDFFGTPLYMAPEQAKGAENGTPASDVYSLGAVLYECIAGEPAFAPGPLAAVLDAILRVDVVDPRRRRASVPEALARIALQCLEKDPRDRYPSAAALAADLRRFARGESVTARSSGVVRALRRWRRRPRRLVAAFLVVALLVVAAVVAWRQNAVAGGLQTQLDLQQVDDLLARGPERVTAFGGASRRFYARLGLVGLGDRDAGRSPAAVRALALAAATVARTPDDAAALRTLAIACIDVGDDDAASEKAIRSLLACTDCTAADRTMAAVWLRQQGRDDEALALREPLASSDPDVAYWLGFWHQDEQDHVRAIDAFTRALASTELPTERRYWALLHRGWCRTCPDVLQLQAAQDDLLQAAALRPQHATPLLLVAALRCLLAGVPADLDGPVAMVQKALAGAEPWLHVLAARVLLAMAEAGTVASGPLAFGAEFSPLAVLPVRPEFARAFADLALGLLDGVVARSAAEPEAELLRLTALALLGRGEEALQAAARLRSTWPTASAVAVDLQIARVHLANGSPARALAVLGSVLALDPSSIPARRLEALAAAQVGDATRQLAALDALAQRLAATAREVCVFPDAAAMLPEVQLARVRVLQSLGRVDDARRLLTDGDFGGPLAGAASVRVQAQRRALLVASFGSESTAAMAPPAIDSSSPLRWLLAPAVAATVDPRDAAVRAALWRGWLPASVRVASDPRLDPVLQRLGQQVPSDVDNAPFAAVAANLAALADAPGGTDRVLARVDAQLAAAPDHEEARLLRAVLLQRSGRDREALECLRNGGALVGDDLRVRYLSAVIAQSLGERDLLRAVLQRGDGTLSANELDLAAALVPIAKRPRGAELLSAAD